MPAKSKSKKQKEEEAPDAEVITMEEELEPEVAIEDLPGVGPATAEKLREAGFDELLALAVMSPRPSRTSRVGRSCRWKNYPSSKENGQHRRFRIR